MLYSIALTFLPTLSASQILELLRHCPDAEALVTQPEQTLTQYDVTDRPSIVAAIIAGRDAALQDAKAELDYCEKYGIRVLPYGTPDYPTRLLDCPDAPALLYFKGEGNLNASHVLGIVGTRKISEYGKQMCEAFTERLAEILPDTLVVSGLAYGVDIHTHRGCMARGISTVGVVAHGLDQIYPASHRNDAAKMLAQGGILTEYTRGTRPLPNHFLQRNRIIAGMSDAVLVVESASHGGSLVTAKIADSYQRQVFAVPGRANDVMSTGCNALIRSMRASMATTADDIVHDMGWWEESVTYRYQHAKDSPAETEPSLFSATPSPLSATSSPEHLSIIAALQGSDGMNPTQIAAATSLPLNTIQSFLFDMELDGTVKSLPGNLYNLRK